jgi:hypothetical protein
MGMRAHGFHWEVVVAEFWLGFFSEFWFCLWRWGEVTALVD